MFFRSASFCGSPVMNLSASLPVPPYGVNSRGLKELCSISITRCRVVHTFLLILVTLKGCVEFLVQVAFCEWVEHPYIKECLLPLLPETASSEIQSSFIGRVGTAA